MRVTPSARPLRLLLSLLALLLLLVPVAWAGWGADLDPDQGRKMLKDVEKDLLYLVNAPEDEHDARIERFATKSARGAIEALKRSRNPELLDLFVRLLDHDDWRVVHRALLVLEHYWEPSTFPRAWILLTHPERRIREKAAITCIKLWDGSQKPEDVDILLAGEQDFHVRRCLEALKLRAQGELPLERVHREVVEKQENGLLRVPFVGAPGSPPRPAETKKPYAKRARGGGKRLGRAETWVGPLLGYGEEEVVGGPLEPFGSLTPDGGKAHAGQDLGACLDGAGVYAPAEGILRVVEAGFKGGTVLAIEHAVENSGRVVTVLLHGGDTVFATAGSHVEAGQLLTTIGMSWSPENGGHVAHIHLGFHEGSDLPPTGFDGWVSSEADGLRGWLDPAEFLASWVERTRPLVAIRRALDPAFEGAIRHLKRGEIGQAYGSAKRVQKDVTDLRIREEGEWLLGKLETAPQALMERARAWLRAGYPTRALQELEKGKRTLAGLPDVSILGEEIRMWKADQALEQALEGEKKVAALEKKTARSRKPEKLREKWEELSDAYGGTALAPRIDRHLDN